MYIASKNPQVSQILRMARKSARARRAQTLSRRGTCQRRAASSTRSIRQPLQAQRQLTRQTIAGMTRRVSSCVWVVAITSSWIMACSTWVVATLLRIRATASGAVSKNSLRGGSRGNPPPWVDFIRCNLIDIFGVAVPYNSSGVVLYVGGNYNQNLNYGLFYLNGNNSASNSNSNIGCRKLLYS